MDWAKLAKSLLLSDQRVSEHEALLVGNALREKGPIDREGVDFLLKVKREALFVHPEFDRLLFGALQGVVMRDGVISDAEALWLRKVILKDNQAVGAEVEFLHALLRDARSVGEEFTRLLHDCTQVSSRNCSRV